MQELRLGNHRLQNLRRSENMHLMQKLFPRNSGRPSRKQSLQVQRQESEYDSGQLWVLQLLLGVLFDRKRLPDMQRDNPRLRNVLSDYDEYSY
jgi:hypothetical protein